jgi:predicted nucleic acid-binding protein
LTNLLAIYDIQSEDYSRLFQIMEKYQDRQMDLADATLVLTAEKIEENRILTLDSDFLFYRIKDKNSFHIIQHGD